MGTNENDTDALLKEVLRVSRENNRMLRSMHRSAVISFWVKILFYAFLIGLPLVIYRYYLADYVRDITSTYEEVRTDLQDLGASAVLPLTSLSGTDEGN